MNNLLSQILDYYKNSVSNDFGSKIMEMLYKAQPPKEPKVESGQPITPMQGGPQQTGQQPNQQAQMGGQNQQVGLLQKLLQSLKAQQPSVNPNNVGIPGETMSKRPWGGTQTIGNEQAFPGTEQNNALLQLLMLKRAMEQQNPQVPQQPQQPPNQNQQYSLLKALGLIK